MTNATDTATPNIDTPSTAGPSPISDVINRIPVQTSGTMIAQNIASDYADDELSMDRRSAMLQTAVISVVTVLLACGFWVVFGGLLANTLGR